MDEDDNFGIDALGIHATNEERMEMVVMRMPPEQRDMYRRLSFDLGIFPHDKRWQFLELITRFGPEAANAMMREVGRVNYHFSESEIDAWQAHVSTKVAAMSDVLSLDARFDAETKQPEQTVAPKKKVSVVKRLWARFRCFIHSSKEGVIS